MLDNIYVVDIEGNSLNPTKLHVISIGKKVDGAWKISSYTDYPSMVLALKEIENSGGTIIGHNFISYDRPHLERLLGIKLKSFIIDTLMLSWYLEPNMLKVGLEEWGVIFNYPKVPIEDWENLPIETYVERCETDIFINIKTYEHLYRRLSKLYQNNIPHMEYVIRYLMFKMDCAALKEKCRWKVDLDRVQEYLSKFTEAKNKKTEELLLVMPKVEVKKVVKKPEKMFKKDGELTVMGSKWLSILEENKLPPDYENDIEIISGYKDPNPGSMDQIKNWLYDKFQWKPITFKYVRDKTNPSAEVRKVPQLFTESKEICPSIKALYEKEPKLELIEGYGVLSNRIATLKGFLKDVSEDGYLIAGVAGVTSTLRERHRGLVNLPGVVLEADKKSETDDFRDGSYIRGCLTAPEGYELCGTDLKSLEENCKRHFLQPLDPKLCEESGAPDYDPHLSLAVAAGRISESEMEAHKRGEINLKAIRQDYKTVNYSAIYGIGVDAIARATKKSKAEAKKLLDAYWKKNWAVKKIAEDAKVKECLGGKWIWNPVSKLWYSLRYEKDRFSALNQSTGAFCFDTLLKFLLTKRLELTGSFHDEFIWTIKENSREKCTELINWAIDETNKQLKLNVPLAVDIHYGKYYSDIH